MYRADLSVDLDRRCCWGCWRRCETTNDEPPVALPASDDAAGADRDDESDATPNPFAQDARAKKKSSKTAFIGQSIWGHEGVRTTKVVDDDGGASARYGRDEVSQSSIVTDVVVES
jgi:hypothetical protein